MTTTIAVSGKGGSGKTTLASMLVRALLEHSDSGPILCIDADPNSCLAPALGMPTGTTVASIREFARKKPVNDGGMDRVRTFEYGLQQAIVEAGRFDLVTMGHPEGPSCYCAVNSVLRRILDEVSAKYQFVIIDNEAGMEHLSRRTTNGVDLLCIVSEPTPVGRLTANRILDLVRQLQIVVKRTGVLWNRTRPGDSEDDGFDVIARIPEDAQVLDASRRGESVFALPDDAPALQAARTVIEPLLLAKRTRLASKC